MDVKVHSEVIPQQSFFDSSTFSMFSYTDTHLCIGNGDGFLVGVSSINPQELFSGKYSNEQSVTLTDVSLLTNEQYGEWCMGKKLFVHSYRHGLSWVNFVFAGTRKTAMKLVKQTIL